MDNFLSSSAMSINWSQVSRVLVVKLRSIGDTVLATPSLIALRRFLPEAQIDIVLEDWVAPILDGADFVDDVIIAGSGLASRAGVISELRRRHYDIAFNLHGGTTSTFLTAASGAKHRIGYDSYKYSFLYNHRLSSSSDFWKSESIHSAEQQLALVGFVGVPVDDRPRSTLPITPEAERSIEIRLAESGLRDPQSQIALIHPTSAFFTKRWPIENYASVAEYLEANGMRVVAIGSANESEILLDLTRESAAKIITFNDLKLPEITALASRSSLFIGNDSGIAHIAAAVDTPGVVIFGSSNRAHWRPWT
ncbi:MAG: glycosyltransferase family 9 protein, partial [Blastocatellia bacterium]|nr:glycosyltransferase family 9 protein [Blastocatellia bacterium]